MKNLMLLPLLAVSVLVYAGPIEDEIIARIHKVGELCLVGQACASGQMMEAVSDSAASPEAIYERSCSTGHDLGSAGAANRSDLAPVVPRVETGSEPLYDSGTDGLAPGRPAKGLRCEGSYDDTSAVVDYMFAGSQ